MYDGGCLGFVLLCSYSCFAYQNLVLSNPSLSFAETWSAKTDSRKPDPRKLIRGKLDPRKLLRYRTLHEVGMTRNLLNLGDSSIAREVNDIAPDAHRFFFFLFPISFATQNRQ